MKFEEFITYMTEHPDFSAKMEKCASSDEAYALAKEVGLNMEQCEFMDAMKKVNDSFGTMSANDVDAIVGGMTSTQIVSVVASGVGATASAAGVAAGAGAAV